MLVRIFFAGTPDIAAAVLQQLIDSPHDVVGVLTRPDAPIGRRRTLTPSPVAALAEGHGIPVVRATRVTDEVVDAVAAKAPELGVVVAYGALLPDRLLAVPEHGWINLHVSLLPAWRGAAPVQRAIAAGDDPLGLSVIQVTSELDAGDILTQRPIAGLERATAGQVLARMGDEGAQDVLAAVDALAAGTAHPTAQTGPVSIAAKLDRDFGRLDWSLPTRDVFNRWRAATPEPGAWSTLDDATFKVVEVALLDDPEALPAEQASPGSVVLHRKRVLAATGDGWLQLVTVQPAGRAAMPARAWINGRQSEAVFA